MPRALVMPCASRGPNRRVFRRSQILALGTAYLLKYRLGSTPAVPLATALKNSAALNRPRTRWSSCIIPTRASPALGQDGLVPGKSSGATAQTSRFSQRYPCSHLQATWSRAAFWGNARLRLMRSAPGTTLSISLEQLLCKLFPLCHLAHMVTANALGSTRVPESRWATSPPRKMALGPLQASHWPPKCSVGAVLRAAPRCSRSLDHRRTSATLLRRASQGSNTGTRAITVPKFRVGQIIANSWRPEFHLPKSENRSPSAPLFRR